MKSAKANDVVAIRGEGEFDRVDINAADVDDDQPELVRTEAVMWLAVVVTPLAVVTQDEGATVLGKKLQKGDGYITIQWLSKLNDKQYELLDAQDCIWESQSLMGSSTVNLGKYRLPTAGNRHKAKKPYPLAPQNLMALKAML